MKHIIHDWDDERATTDPPKLPSRDAPGGKVLLVDAVIPPVTRAHFGKLLDLEMLALTPRGRERTKAEFRDLLQRSGFKLRRVIPSEIPPVPGRRRKGVERKQIPIFGGRFS